MSNINNNEQGQTLGSDAEVRFVSVGNKTVKGKVDTGATTSSLNASEITVNQEQNKVTFRSPAISDNLVTMDLAGAQEVHSADGGAKTRPVVKFDIEINGTPVQGVTFNLNDRAHMDTDVLIGQNVLKAGNFTIDVNKDTAPERVEQVQNESAKKPTDNREDRIKDALQILYNNKVTLDDLLTIYPRITK